MITYTDKVTLVSNPNPDINKVTAGNMNEIKSVVNTNETALGTKVPTTRILTIDGVPFDLSADRSWTSAADKFTNVYNVAQNGLVGDTVTDNSAALTTLVATLVAGDTLYFPTGTFLFLSKVTIDKQINILGNGINSVIYTTANNITIIDYDNGVSTINDILIRDVKIFCNPSSTPVAPSSGLRIDSSIRLRVTNVLVQGFYTNVTLVNPVAYVFEKFYCNGWVEGGLDMRSSGSFVDAGDGSIVSSQFVPTSGYSSVYSIYQENGGGLKIVNTKFNYDASPLTRTQYHYYYEGTGITVDLNISNCSFENFTAAAIRVGVSGAGAFSEIAITGNDIGAGTGTTGIDGIILSGVSKGSIVGNTFLSTVSGTDIAISLTNCNDFIIFNQYSGWSTDVSQSGCTGIIIPVLTDAAINPSNDDVLQRKSGAWTNRTIAQLLTDLAAVVGPASATDGMVVAFDGTTGKLIKAKTAWVNWGASLAQTGFSATSVTNSYYQDDGRTITIFIDIQGTSNATGFTFQLPVAPNAVYGTVGLMVSCVTLDGAGGGTNATGRVFVTGGSTTVTVGRIPTVDTFQNSGPKGVRVTLTYMK